MCFDSDDESQASTASSEWSSEPSTKGQSPTSTKPMKFYPQAQVPVFTSFTTPIPHPNGFSIPSPVPPQSNSRTDPQSSAERLSEAKVKAVTNAHARSSNPPSGTTTQVSSMHTQSIPQAQTTSEQPPETRTRDPRRRPTLTQSVIGPHSSSVELLKGKLVQLHIV